MQDCKYGTEMVHLSKDSVFPSEKSAFRIGDAIVWWCGECGRTCVTGEILGTPPVPFGPNWMEPRLLKNMDA